MDILLFPQRNCMKLFVVYKVENMKKKTRTVGVMGGAASNLSPEVLSKITPLADQLGKAIATRHYTLITGETSGIPGLVAEYTSTHGGLTVGISGAHSQQEHKDLYGVPAQDSDVVIYTGFGLKGRNVINVRSSDIVIIFSGSIGTLNEFTIAYDEGKVIGVLEGTGGVADMVQGIVDTLAKKTGAIVIYDQHPEALLDKCISAFESRG